MRAAHGTSRRLAPGVAKLLYGLVLLATLPAAVPASACVDTEPRSAAFQKCQLIEEGSRAIFEDRFTDADAIWQKLREFDPSDAVPVLFQIETAWARLLYDEAVTEYDETIRALVTDAIRLADARLEKDADDPIALYHKGDALIQRARLDGIRRNYMVAGRDGERGRKLLERALSKRPDETEIKYSLGLYLYYTSAAPDLLKWLDWLWFIPEGNSKRGLQYLTDVRDGGGRHSTKAKFIVMNINTYHAPMDLPAALQAGRELHESFPTNTLYLSELVEVLVKIGMYDEAVEFGDKLQRSSVLAPEAKGRPQLGRILGARAMALAGRPDEAWKRLEGMDPETAVLPSWGGAWIHLVRGHVHDIRGEREQALVEYERVKRLKGPRYSPRASLIAEGCIDTAVKLGTYEELPMLRARSK